MKFLDKIRELPLEKRKIILWTIIIIVAIILIIFWIRSFQVKLVRFQEKRENLDQELIFPEIKIPETNFSEQDLEEMENIFKAMEENKEQEIEPSSENQAEDEEIKN